MVDLRARGYRRLAAQDGTGLRPLDAAGGRQWKQSDAMDFSIAGRREMRHKALRTLLVALFACALLLPGLGASAGEQAPGAGKTPVVKQPIAPTAPEAESGAVAPGEAEGFNPQPEPPARKVGPGPVAPGGKKAMEPGDDEKGMDPVDERTMDPVDK
jgi:hypothetical protein